MSAELKLSFNLTTLACYRCGIVFGIPSNRYRVLHETGDNFWCPNGHDQCFMETVSQRHRKDMDRKEQELERERKRTTAARARAKMERNRASAFKGQVTQIKNRVGAGVCPCCNRTFKQLARHMAAKHPEFRDG